MFNFDEDQARKLIREKAGPEDGPGWISLSGKQSFWRVPRAPFDAWEILQDRRNAEEVTYEPVCPRGLRLSCDIPTHSDWLLGARRYDRQTGQWVDGQLSDYHKDDDLLMAAVRRQRAKGSDDGYIVLVEGPSVEGVALVEPPEDLFVCPPNTVLVLDKAEASWLFLASTAVAVIVEVGGALSHLIAELREVSIPVLRVPNACREFTTGERILVDPTTGLVQVIL